MLDWDLDLTLGGKKYATHAPKVLDIIRYTQAESEGEPAMRSILAEVIDGADPADALGWSYDLIKAAFGAVVTYLVLKKNQSIAEQVQRAMMRQLSPMPAAS